MYLSRPTWIRIALLVLIICPTRLGVRSAAAQDSRDEVTPEVQRLYSEAKAAQQQNKTELAISKYRAMLKLAPHLAAAYNNLGVLYFNQRDYAKAAEVLEKGLAIDPGMNTASALLGISYFKLGRNVEARSALEKALAANPGDDNAEMTLARLLIVSKHDQEAADRLRAYLVRNPKDQQALYLLGKTYLRLSEESLGKINAIDPDSVTAHEVAGEIDESMHNYDSALGEYKRAIELAPQQPGTHFHLANDFWLLGKWESAQAEFEAELQNDPDNCTAQWKLGNVLLAQNRPPVEALPHLDKAVERCPDLMQARVDRASALIKTGKPDEALPDLLMAEKDSPTEPSIHFLLSQAYKATGKASEAHEELQTYGRLQRAASEATAKQAGDDILVKSAAH